MSKIDLSKFNIRTDLIIEREKLSHRKKIIDGITITTTKDNGNYITISYEDITDCSSLWFKKCTSNENLLYEYTFKTKDGDKIIVTEDINGTFNDNHKKDATINDNVEEPTIEIDKTDEDPIATPDVPVAEA